MKRRCAVGAGGVGLTAEVALHGRIGIGIGRHKSPGRARLPALLYPAVEAWARWHWPAAACGLACTPCRAVARLRRCGNGRATTDSPPPELCSEICAASEAGFQSWHAVLEILCFWKRRTSERSQAATRFHKQEADLAISHCCQHRETERRLHD